MSQQKPVHVMHVLGNLGMGGAEMGVVRLITAMSDDRIRHSIVILGSDHSLLEELNLNIPCHALGIDKRSYTAFFRLADLFRRKKVDLVHVNNLSPWLDAALGAKLAGCRCIETFHGVEQGLLSFSLAKQMLFRGAGLLSHRITAVADEAADLLSQLTGLSRVTVEVIPNGIDTDHFLPAESFEVKCALRRSKDLPEDALLFGCVAALRPVKNHQGLLRAFAQATNDVLRPALLVLVGDGPLAGDLKQLAKSLGIADQVVFLGRRDDVAELLQCFDAFVLNSDTEGLSYAVLEAMSCGLPLLGTAVGGNVKLVSEGLNGCLVPVSDEVALAKLLSKAMIEPDTLKTMGMEARQRVESDYGMERMINCYRNLYLDCALSRGGC